jgi:hypothetical protein
MDFDGVEPHIPQVVGEESAGQGLTIPRYHFDGFHGRHASNASGDGSEYREASLPVRRWRRGDAFQARSLTGQECGESRLEFIHRCFDHGGAGGDGLPVHEEALFKEGGAIDYQVGLRYKPLYVSGVDIFGDAQSFKPWVEFLQAAFHGFDTGLADPIVGHE